MVVLAASITTRAGKPLLSRQFREITKDRVLELLSNFQSLVANLSSEHTFVEDEHVRYVYKPFDDYYIILITNRQSNIIQDLSTLNLFAQTVNSYLSSYEESEMYDNAFEILSSFDEIVVMGYKENLSITQVNTYLSMESHEERIQEIIERNKEFEATEERKRRAKEIARREQERKMGINPTDFGMPASNFTPGNDPNIANAYNSYYGHPSQATHQPYMKSQTSADDLSGNSADTTQGHGARGMKLGGSSKRNVVKPTRTATVSTPKQQESEEDLPENNGILILIKETVNAEITRDGAISSSELKGVLELRINDRDLAHSKLELNDEVQVKDRSLQFKTHPNIDKNAFLSSKVIGLRDSEKAFPSNDKSLGVLRWRKVGAANDKTLVPLEVSTWVSPSNEQEGIFEVTVEFEINPDYEQPIEDLLFTIPVFTENCSINTENNDSNASIVSIDEELGISIKVDPISPGSTGVFGFVIDSGHEDSIFPLNIDFTHTENNGKSISGMGIRAVKSSQEEDRTLPYDVITSLKSEEYVIV